jgi:hypothetical protein
LIASDKASGNSGRDRLTAGECFFDLYQSRVLREDDGRNALWRATRHVLSAAGAALRRRASREQNGQREKQTQPE